MIEYSSDKQKNIYYKIKHVLRILKLLKIITSVALAVLVSGSFADSKDQQVGEKLLKINSLILYLIEAIPNRNILNFDFAQVPTPVNIINIKACRGEFEPASFVIRANSAVTKVEIAITDLINSAGKIIPYNAFDVRIVKDWYQAGRELWETKKRILVPELLLKDDDFVKVDLENKKNLLRINLDGHTSYIDISSPGNKIPENSLLEDAKSLQPFNLSAGSDKQVWITVHVPLDAAAGKYKGSLKVKAEEDFIEIPIQLEVLPFELADSNLQYAIYYRGMITSDFKKNINSDLKSQLQYKKELRNILDHGVTHPTIYQSYDAFFLPKSLEIRQELNLANDNLYVLGLITGNSSNLKELELLSREVRKFKKIATSYGYKNIFFYGMDEASGDQLKSQRKAWQEVHNEGGFVFVACSKGAVDTMGDLLDLAVLHGRFDSEEVSKWHDRGKRVFSYSNPQVGVEDFDIYRNNYGYKLFAEGYDGAMNYAYQHGFNDIWNDFDTQEYRDHVFAYPTSNGVVDTIQWEGFREAVDDIRYLSTLVKIKNHELNRMKLWLRERLALGESAKIIREKIIRKIIE